MTVFFLCPGSEEPSGGVLKIHEFAHAVTYSGEPAQVVYPPRHRPPGWLPADLRSLRASVEQEIHLTSDDLLVVPEIYAWLLARTALGCRRLILNQGAYLTFRHAPLPPSASTPYAMDGVVGVACVSDDNMAYLDYAFPALDKYRIRLGIDSVRYAPGSKTRSIAYMPRRRAEDLRQVLGIVMARGGLEGWELLPIDGLALDEVAEVLARAWIFLHGPHPGGEGFPLPLAEAMSSACVVVGYAGRGGTELLSEATGYPVPDGDVVAYAKALERICGAPQSLDAARRAAAGRRLVGNYTESTQAEDVRAAIHKALAKPGFFREGTVSLGAISAPPVYRRVSAKLRSLSPQTRMPKRRR